MTASLRRRRRSRTIALVGTDSHEDFRRARRSSQLARAVRRLTTRPDRERPRDLDDLATLSWGARRLRPIPLDAIVGTVDATRDFDASFRPATNRIAPRWERVARAYREGRPLPPISVLERPDGYYVIDGRHRVSVARALGQTDIDAWTSPTGSTLGSLATRVPPAPGFGAERDSRDWCG